MIKIQKTLRESHRFDAIFLSVKTMQCKKKYYLRPTLSFIFSVGTILKNVKKSVLNKLVDYESHLYILIL